MKNLFQSAALVTITALLVSVGRGDAEQTAPIAYGQSFQLICASGTIDDAMMFEGQFSTVDLSWRIIENGGVWAGTGATLNECTAFPVGTQGGSMAPSESSGSGYNAGDTVTVGSDGCELIPDGIGPSESIAAGTELTIIRASGMDSWQVKVGPSSTHAGDVGFVDTGCLDLNIGA